MRCGRAIFAAFFPISNSRGQQSSSVFGFAPSWRLALMLMVFGALSWASAGDEFSLTPDPLAARRDRFEHARADGNVGKTTFVSTNRAPTQQHPDWYTTPPNGTRRIEIGEELGVLSNAANPDLAGKGTKGLNAILVSGPAHAADFKLNANGSFHYEPTPGFVGFDTFKYKVGGSSDATERTVAIDVPRPIVAIVALKSAGKLTGIDNKPDGAGFAVIVTSGAVNFPITVPFQLAKSIGKPHEETGRAMDGLDFVLSETKSVTIDASMQRQEIGLTVKPDKFVEGPEHIFIQLQYPDNDGGKFELAGLKSSAMLTIADNDYWKWDEQTPSSVQIDYCIMDPTIGDGPWSLNFYGHKYGYDSLFMAGGMYRVRPSGLSVAVAAEWIWYGSHFGGGLIVPNSDSLHRRLDYNFDYEPISGQIRIRSGSGIDGPTWSGRAHIDIDFNYKIDNSGVLLKTVDLSFNAVAGVGGSNSTTHEPRLGGIGSGTGRRGYTEFLAGGGSALNESGSVTLRLRATEDPTE